MVEQHVRPDIDDIQRVDDRLVLLCRWKQYLIVLAIPSLPPPTKMPTPTSLRGVLSQNVCNNDKHILSYLSME